MTFDPSRIAMQLRVMRHRAGLTQKELSNKSGVGEKSVAAFETRRTRSMKLWHAIALAEACGSTVADLLDLIPTEEECLFLDIPVRQPAKPVRRQVDASPYPSASCALGWPV